MNQNFFVEKTWKKILLNFVKLCKIKVLLEIISENYAHKFTFTLTTISLTIVNADLNQKSSKKYTESKLKWTYIAND